MKKTLLLMMAFAVMSFAGLTGVSAQETDDLGIGVELGVNHVISNPGNSNDSANSVSFALDYALTDALRVGLYREQVDSEDGAGVAGFNNIALSAIQITNEIHDMFLFGARFGSADADTVVGTVPYGGLYGTVTPFSATTDTFSGAINLNLGYDFIPDAGLNDLLKIGISARISF